MAFAEDAVCSSSLVTPKLQTNIRVFLVQSNAQKAAEAERAQRVEAPSTAAETTLEESEEDIDWENMDLDAVKLPGTKKEELPATESVKRPPAEEIRVRLRLCKQSWHHWESASGVCVSTPAVCAGSDQYLSEAQMHVSPGCRLLMLQLQWPRSRGMELWQWPASGGVA